MGIIQNSLLKTLPVNVIYSRLLKEMKDYDSFKKKFFEQDPEISEILQERMLLHAFARAAQNVPQYKKFLKQHKIDPAKIRSVDDFVSKVPETNKHNYIYKAKKLGDLCVYGDISQVSMVVKSSGHSGRQTYWLKSHSSDPFVETVLGMGLDLNYGIRSKRTLVLNGFILGSWVAGINFGEYTSWNCPVINIGPDSKEIIQTLTDLKGQFDQFIISGYPPFLKSLADDIVSSKHSFSKGSIHFFPGAEGFPESWREYMQSKFKGAKIVSGFGASDIGLLGGMENEDSIFIRKLAEKNLEFRKELFGEELEVPMLFQYPFSNHIRTNDKRELIFSTILPSATEPVLNYNLEDQGGVVTYREMETLLAKYGITRKIKAPMPFFYYIGRSSGAVNYNGFFIYPENIKDCIYQNKVIADSCTGRFHMHVGYVSDQSKKLTLHFQLKKNQRNSKRLKNVYCQNIVKTLSSVNGGYRATLQKFGDLATPEIVLVPFDTFNSSKIKNQYLDS